MNLDHKIRVLIVDDHLFFRQGVRFFIEDHPEIELRGEAATGKEAIDLLESMEVDVVLMDLQMPRLNGTEATKQILARWPAIKVLILTSFNHGEKVFEALQVGASGYILKDTRPEELVIAIKAIAAGGNYLDPTATSQLMQNVAPKPAQANPPDHQTGTFTEPLTEREVEVLRLITQGLGNKEIGARLIISEKTVKTHITNIMQKMQVTSRTQAAMVAIKEKMI